MADDRPGQPVPRHGDEIVVCGQLFRLGGGVRVYTFMDPGGYDAYRVERRFGPLESSEWDSISRELKTPNRYGMRRSPKLSAAEVEQVRGGGWTLEQLRRVVDQFVIHCDACGLSQRCFEVLQDRRGLSCHFLLDLDGTIYQTLDLKERGWHATISNDRSVGIEIANVGAYLEDEKDKFDRWYKREGSRTRIVVPPEARGGGIKTKNFIGHPVRPHMIVDELQGRKYRQYDYTQQQYNALIRLTAALSAILPQIRLECPRDAASGKPLPRKLPDAELAAFKGVLGHYHIQAEKNDPGPAFQWDYVLKEAHKLLHPPPPRSHSPPQHPATHGHHHGHGHHGHGHGHGHHGHGHAHGHAHGHGGSGSRPSTPPAAAAGGDVAVSPPPPPLSPTAASDPSQHVAASLPTSAPVPYTPDGPSTPVRSVERVSRGTQTPTHEPHAVVAFSQPPPAFGEATCHEEAERPALISAPPSVVRALGATLFSDFAAQTPSSRPASPPSSSGPRPITFTD
eukprot:tig00000551_g2042.t1